MGKKSRAKRERREGSRLVKMNPEMHAALQEQIQRFRDKFGREPGPDDPVFFDPDSDTPQPYSAASMEEIAQEINRAMGAAGIDPAIIYATQKTGRLAPPSRQVYEAMSPNEKAEWDAALEEYDALAASANTRPQ